MQQANLQPTFSSRHITAALADELRVKRSRDHATPVQVTEVTVTLLGLCHAVIAKVHHKNRWSVP